MGYSKEFKDLINECEDSSTYIGTGNPDAKILIIGKECAIDTNINEGQIQHEKEIISNLHNWRINEEMNMKQADVEAWSCNPLYPYRGQQLTIRRVRGGKVSGKEGTSATWYYYQKLINQIVDKVGKENKEINFHEYCFVSELSTICGKYSRNIVKEARAKSVKERTLLFKKDFFQQFQVAIIAAGHYPRDFDIKLEEIFGTKLIHQIEKEKLGKYWINVHHGINTTPKLLIHTNQFSMISYELVNTIAEICKEFISKNRISL